MQIQEHSAKTRVVADNLQAPSLRQELQQVPPIKERPILFSGAMVRAILEKRKTQTRRVVKDYAFSGPNPPNASTFDVYEGERWVGAFGLNGQGNFTNRCPYGKPGDQLWVRETFMFAKGADVREAFIGTVHEVVLGAPPHYAYRATEPDFGGGAFKWRPSIFMPRKASRLTLEITKIRVERVQKISEKDARAEGVQVREVLYPDEPHSAYSYVEQYHLLWDSINAKRGFGWATNPWVWVIEFRRTS